MGAEPRCCRPEGGAQRVTASWFFVVKGVKQSPLTFSLLYFHFFRSRAVEVPDKWHGVCELLKTRRKKRLVALPSLPRGGLEGTGVKWAK